MLHG
jgi:exosome complex component RRP40